MAGITSDESEIGKSMDRVCSGQHCHSGEAIAEYRCSEQVENGDPSTSPPYWDTDDDDDSGGPKPSELHGKYTWKVEKFSQIDKRELRSNAFEVGGYKWYILIYPQGCDVCNHLSLFLCVAKHDELLPGWSHFAQFTIAVVNKDPKKYKYSDTLHRFWKKEHDWGWKKFMELTKVYDGFVDAADNLIIKAQVQVIRDKADRPFRCLDFQYRRELVRVYLTNVEQICWRFVEERRAKLGKLIEDKARWSSFCAFWWGIDQHTRLCMSRENMDAILKVVVKHFFIEKEVTSTLVMDSLYSGLKALESQSIVKKTWSELSDVDDMPAPIVYMENDMFILVDDVLPLLERAAREPLPPKDEKGPQNRAKDGNSGEDFNRDSIERDERRLTELGRRTIEIFVLAHIFSNRIEVAYQEAIALKRQEELIREEEAGQAESDLKTKRGASEKEKKSKKKQAKQKRHKKGKDKGREEKPIVAAQDKCLLENFNDDKMELNKKEVQNQVERPDTLDDGSDASDSVDGIAEGTQLDSEDRDRDASPVNWDTDTSEVHPPAEPGISNIDGLSSIQSAVLDRKGHSITDDSSLTCSTGSLPSHVVNGPLKGSSTYYRAQKSPRRGESQQGKVTCNGTRLVNQTENSSGSVADLGYVRDGSVRSKVVESEPDTVLQDQSKQPGEDVKQADNLALLQEKLNINDQDNLEGPVARERPPRDKILALAESSGSVPRNLPSTTEMKLTKQWNSLLNPVSVLKPSSNGPQQNDKDLISLSQSCIVCQPSESQSSTTKLVEKVAGQQVLGMSRPSSAPLVPGPRPAAPVVSLVQTVSPPLVRSLSATGRLGPDSSAPTHSYISQSYRNAILGNPVASRSSSFTHATSTNSPVNSMVTCAQQPSSVTPILSSQSSERMDFGASRSGILSDSREHDILQNEPQWTQSRQQEAARAIRCHPSPQVNDQNINMYKPMHSRSLDNLNTDVAASPSRHQTQVLMAEEFPHLDIINDLLDDEHGAGMAAKEDSVFHNYSNGQLLNRQFTFPGEMRTSGDVGSSTSSCRFERSRSYHEDGFQQGYGSSNGVFDSVCDYIPHPSPFPYLNGQLDGLTHKQWQMADSDLSYLGLRNAETNMYGYYTQDYSKVDCAVHGYTTFHPSSGH